jgi:hypothetical protein
MQAPGEGDVQAIGQEGDEDVGFDARLELVKDRPDREIAFEVLERLFDPDKQQIVTPQFGRVFLDEIGAQEIPALVIVPTVQGVVGGSQRMLQLRVGHVTSG